MIRLLFVITYLFMVLPVQAQTNSEIQRAEEEIQRKFGDEILQNLYDYRMSVEENAYSVTTGLCPIYRKVSLWNGSEESQTYIPSESASLQFWGDIFYEGLAQPFSAIFGKKADYLNKTNAGFFEIRSWFYSLYVLFLINSEGFEQGAMDCLETTDEEEIDSFAQTIRVVDLLGSSGFYVAEVVAMEKLFSFVFRLLKSPVSRAYLNLLHRLEISPADAKKILLSSAGLTTLTLGNIFWNMYEETQDQAKAIEEMMQEELKRMQEELKRIQEEQK